MMMKSLVLIVALIFAVIANAAPKITNVKAEPVSPWGKAVAIEYTLSGDVLEGEYSIKVTASNRNTQVVYEVNSLKGDISCKKGVHRIWWDMAAENIWIQYAQVDFRVAVIHDAVQLWKNGPCWAKRNIGAENAWDSGYYFWWGDTVGYKWTGSRFDAVDGSKTGFSFAGGNCPTYGKSVDTLKSEGYITEAGELADKYDAAKKHWGGDWRMPTVADIDALINNTTTEWITTNGVPGRLVRGKGTFSDRSIFLPAAGDGGGTSLNYSGSYGSYWSSTPSSGNSGDVWSLRFNSGDFYRYSSYRYIGRSVRPLRGFAK